jgi:hypothetical protein
VDIWADRATLLLAQQDVWEKFSRCSLSMVRHYSFDSASRGLLDACRYAVSERRPHSLQA